jgi:hypothetical protein
MTSTFPVIDVDERSEMNTTPPLDEPATPARRQPGARVEVFFDGEAPYIVVVDNRDRIAYEMTAARHKEWPSRDAGQHFAMTFCTWSAAKRTGRTQLTFEQWRTQLADWDVLEDVPADPTR